MSERSTENDEQFASNVPSTVYGGNLTHVRSDSAFSMDSFVLQARPAVSDDADETEEEEKLDDSISSFPNRDGGNAAHYRRNSSGQSSADSGMPHPPSPVHNFFKEYAFPSGEDAPNDGSIVFNYTAPAAVQSLSRNDRSRFPSFDSIGSSGSVVKKVQPPQNSKPKSSSAPSGPHRAKILPYHERRKLMQQRLAQEQQKRPTPPRPRPPASSQPPFMMPPHPPFPPHTPQQMFPPFPPPQAYGIQPPPHNFVYPPPPLPPNGIPPYPPPPGVYSTTLPVDSRQPSTGSKLYNPQGQNMTLQYARPPIQPLPPYQRSVNSSDNLLPSKQQHQQMTTTTTTLTDSFSYAASSSFDSSDGNNEKRKDLPPPPPPPSMPPPAAHIRQDSFGSVSSLGSVDRGSGTEQQKQQQQQQQQQEPVRSFFDRISPWKASPSPSKEHSVNNFHRKNQAFLSKVERQNSPRSPLTAGSPVVLTTRHRTPLTSMDRPPPSRGGHRRLNSIENDDWTDEPDEEDPLLSKESEDDDATKKRSGAGRSSRRRENYGTTPREVYNSSQYSSSDESEHSNHESDERRNRRPLPPSGISTNEYYDRRYQDSMRTSPYSSSPSPYGSTSGSSSYWQMSPESGSRGRSFDTLLVDNTTFGAWNNVSERESAERRRKKIKKRKMRRSRSRRHAAESDSSSTSSSSSESPSDPWLKHKADFFEQEKARIIESWKKEAREEAERNRWDRRLWRYLKSMGGHVAVQLFIVFAWMESFFGNLPLTIGAIALASANLGVDWFKFTEENLSSCEPVHFHSKQCNFPEFPGCFYCDTSNRTYQVAVNFHFACSCFAGLLAFSFIAKIILAPRVVFDNLSSPTTASPAGLLCMTLNIVFGGRGEVGMFVVSAVSCVHLCLAIWFMYMALAYHIMPEPSWFPNTTGIGLSAVKTWLYHPIAGHFLMAISLTLNFFFFPISLIRVFLNRKISAPVSWMQMSAPDISLYALTIMAQPSFMEENPDVNNFQKLHRRVYLPCMHFLFSLCLIGMAASVTSLVVRWEEFKKQPFSPAHSAFLCPTLSHANAVQAYRGALNAFSTLHRNGLPMRLLYLYWIFVLVSGTILYLCIATRFLLKLPEWTHFDLEDDIEPPAPYETAMTLSNMVQSGETLVQPFVSPAILQANETGTLVLTRDRQGRQKYVRTRRVTALGFEPIMDIVRIEEEREILLDWVARNKPRRRNRTLSVPGIDFNYGAIGTGSGVYGVGQSPRQMRPNMVEPRQGSGRPRSHTLSPQVYRDHNI